VTTFTSLNLITNKPIYIMKRIFLGIILMVFPLMVHAQISEGSWVLETNTTFNAIGGATGVAGVGTGFNLVTSDGTTLVAVGGEAGYFIKEDLALKFGLGYADFDGSGFFSFRFGGKYYLQSKIPLQADLTGQGGDDIFGGENPLFLGLQGGYAFFVTENISIEPTLRYAISLNSVYDGVLQLQVGFAWFLRSGE
jgi:hypothetical protein